MPTIIFVTPDEQRLVVSIKPGANLMEAAVDRDVPGIEAQCYGAGVCGTCHVYASDAARAILPPRSAWEEEMLADMPLANESSRLACQIRFEERFDGVEFCIPERQDAKG